VAGCVEIAPLLSAFSDGEVSAMEADQVTRHLDGCAACKETLADYVLLGHHVRSAMELPSLDGFADAVMAGIAETRVPLSERIEFWLDELRERWVPVVSVAAAAVAVASLVLVILQPQSLVNLFHPGSGTPVAISNQGAPPPPPVTEVAEQVPNDETEISRLEARPPDVATWSEPEDKTTVIWLGDDASEK
jgi:negative regulator of sigma E activity